MTSIIFCSLFLRNRHLQRITLHLELRFPDQPYRQWQMPDGNAYRWKAVCTCKTENSFRLCKFNDFINAFRDEILFISQQSTTHINIFDEVQVAIKTRSQLQQGTDISVDLNAPLAGGRMPQIAFKMVDFPAPFAPMIPRKSPFSSVKETSSTDQRLSTRRSRLTFESSILLVRYLGNRPAGSEYRREMH